MITEKQNYKNGDLVSLIPTVAPTVVPATTHHGNTGVATSYREVCKAYKTYRGLYNQDKKDLVEIPSGEVGIIFDQKTLDGTRPTVAYRVLFSECAVWSIGLHLRKEDRPPSSYSIANVRE